MHKLGDFELAAGRGATDATGMVKVVIRPERVKLEEHGTAGPNRVPAMVERVVYVGPITQLIIREDAHHAVGGTMHKGRQRLAPVRVPVPVERALDRPVPQADVEAFAQRAVDLGMNAVLGRD